jgi:Uma2 family endonuclease
MRTKKRTGTRTRRWTKEEYYRLGEQGFFHGQRVELIEGRLMVQSPQGSLHAGGVSLLTEVLQPLLPNGFIIRVQLPLDLGQPSEPEPDFTVVQGTSRQYLAAHPTSAVLVIEVADSSLGYDRRRKGSLYARAGIANYADYWLLNLVDNRLEVYRDPIPDATQPYGHRYATRVDLVPPAAVSPLAFPGIILPVASLLP